MPERQIGFYWVKFRHSRAPWMEWEVMYWVNEKWGATGCEFSFPESDIDKIDERRIAPPNETEQTSR